MGKEVAQGILAGLGGALKGWSSKGKNNVNSSFDVGKKLKDAFSGKDIVEEKPSIVKDVANETLEGIKVVTKEPRGDE